MSNQGQICTATSRILVQESIYDKFIDAFKKQVKEVSVVGDPFAETTFQGPQVTKAQYDRVLGYIQIGKDEGATLLSGGEAFTNAHPSGKGFFITPTVFTDVKPSMRIYREEVFGPFCAIASFKTEEEAVEMANDTTYGLGSAIFTTNLDRAHKLARRIEAGMVWINSSQDSDYRIPFGGVKQSGIGRELGEAGLLGDYPSVSNQSHRLSTSFRFDFDFLLISPLYFSLFTSQSRSYQLGHKTIGSMQANRLLGCSTTVDGIIAIVVVVVVAYIHDKKIPIFKVPFSTTRSFILQSVMACYISMNCKTSMAYLFSSNNLYLIYILSYTKISSVRGCSLYVNLHSQNSSLPSLLTIRVKATNTPLR